MDYRLQIDPEPRAPSPFNLHLAICIFQFAIAGVFADEVLTTKGQLIEAEVTGGQGSWKIGNDTRAAKDVLYIRLSPEPPPARVESGIFIRGGSLITGSLGTIVGDTAEINSVALGPLKIKRDDVAGAFSPPPPGQQENTPALAHYASILGATLGSHGALLQPGKKTRIQFAGLDELAGEKLMRVGTEQIMVLTKNKGVETVSRQFVRLLEIGVPPATAATPEDDKLGPEFIVRLKSGDLLRGRVLKLTAKSLLLKTAFLGEREIERNLVAVIFPFGGANSNVMWLSALKPAKAAHVPVFDSDFPARMDASNDGGEMSINGKPIERGIGVHSRSELTYECDGSPVMLVSIVGIDAETNNRGQVSAKILADGREVWKADSVTPKDGAKVVAVDLGTPKSVTLFVDFGADEDDSGDHFDWGWVAIIKK